MMADGAPGLVRLGFVHVFSLELHGGLGKRFPLMDWVWEGRWLWHHLALRVSKSSEGKLILWSDRAGSMIDLAFGICHNSVASTSNAYFED
jgi:hypothetical protein